MRTGLVTLALLAGSIVACNTDPGKDKTKASVSEAVSVPAPTGSAATTTYGFSEADSKLEFVGAKVTRQHDGSFQKFSGTIQTSDGKPESSRVTVDVDVGSLNVADSTKLTGHLKSPDFFDVAQFPRAKFTSTSVKAGGEKGATHTVTGNLELHGVTKSLSFPATIRFGEQAVEADAEFAINRKDFGIVYSGMADDLIKDEVAIKLTIRAGANKGP